MPIATHPASIAAVMVAAALASLSTQLLVPALPVIARGSGFDAALASSLVSVTFLVIAFATFAWGPAADRLGRRPVLLLGLILYVAGNLLCLFAMNYATLLLGRVIQAAGGAAGLVLAAVILRDLYESRTDVALARMNVVNTLVPMFAPLTAGILLDLLHWRIVFLLPLVTAIIVFAIIGVGLPETRPTTAAARTTTLLQDAGALLFDRAYVAHVAFSALFMALFFAFQAGAPRLVLDGLGVAPTVYGGWFMVAAVGYALGNVCAARFARAGRLRVALLPSAVAALFAAVVGAIWLDFGLAMAPLFVPLIAIAFFGAIAMTAAHARAVSVAPARTGSASALLVLTQMILAAAATQAVAFLPGDGVSLYGFLATLAAAALAALSLGRRAGPARDALEAA